jgi:hypothetical protein
MKMTIWKTRSLAMMAAVLLAGCSTNNYYGDQSGNYAYDNGGYSNQYSQPYDQYADQGNVDVDVDVSFGTFERELSPYGNWTYHSRWGDVWRPRVAVGFKPYMNGYWANTREYGWMWISDDPWGDTTYRYGRWVFDPRDGWLWVPGYVWAPSWVVWRNGGGMIGWFPMPPDDYYGNGPYRGNYASFYGYRDWYGPSFGNDTFFSLWIFVGEDRFADRDYRRYVVPQRDYGRVIVNTTEVTNYVTINNHIVNRSINVERIERASNRRIETVEARSVMRGRAMVTPVAAGRQIEERERRARPIPARQNVRDVREDVRDAREDVRDIRENARDRREDIRDAREDVRDARQNPVNPRLNARDAREDVRDAREDVRDTREDVRDRRENVRDLREDVRDARNPRGVQPQNATAPQPNGPAERAVRVPRQNVQAERAAERAERAVERGNAPPAVQPAGARQNEAAPVQAGGRAAVRQQRQEQREEREAEQNENNAERAVERRRNANR